ncbi:hypothetical protein BH09BAC3_BH09BAC3_00080 [soil metagenome]
MQSYVDSLLNDEIQEFILLNEGADVHKLLLKHKEVRGVPMEWIANQIAGRKKTKLKLANWYSTNGIIYPPSLNLEQSSSDATAKLKLLLLQGLIADEEQVIRAVDLTGGFGVDTYSLSRRAQHIDYVEPDTELYEITKHNHKILKGLNITHYNAAAEDYVETLEENVDLFFIDPSRRKGTKKIFKLGDCEPNVVEMFEDLLRKGNYVLIKTSPLLDIQQGLRELKHVLQVIVVAVENECKELLFLLKRDFNEEPAIRVVELNRYGEIVTDATFSIEEEKTSKVTFSKPLTFLYEPSAAVLKAGAFKWIGEKYNIKKVAASSHLYTSDDAVDFPGKMFKVIEHVKLDKKLVDKFPNGYSNILIRNYPMTVEEVKTKTGLKEGGEQFLICTQTDKEKFVMIAERVK